MAPNIAITAVARILKEMKEKQKHFRDKIDLLVGIFR